MKNELGRQCVILVGGKGSRLGALTKDIPKPLLEVDNLPFLHHVISNTFRFGFTDYILLAGYLGDHLKAFSKSIASKLDVDIRVVIEQEMAGTAGALLYAKDMLSDEFLMLNGDSIFDINLLDLATKNTNADSIGSLALRYREDTLRFGVVELDGNEICAFKEKPDTQGAGLVNGGMYWLCNGILSYIDKTPCSLETDIFPVLAENKLLHGWVYNNKFIDIGVPEDLVNARKEWPDFEKKPAVFLIDLLEIVQENNLDVHNENSKKLHEIAKSIKFINDNGWYVFNVSGAGIDQHDGRFIYTEVNKRLRNSGAHIDDVCTINFSDEQKRKNTKHHVKHENMSDVRIASCIRDWSINISSSIFITNNETDSEELHLHGINKLIIGKVNDINISELLEETMNKKL